MIKVIVQKELTEFRRDGRVLAMALLIAGLLLVSLVTGWAAHTEQDREVRESQRLDDAAFLEQGAKEPHSAAHFGRMAYKPAAAFSVFDPGAAPYLGQVIWLEAHRRDPAMFRPAEDAPELRRLADLSVAGILTMLLPLLIFVMSHGCFAAERERGTLQHVMSLGTPMQRLFAGKLIAVAAWGGVFSFAGAIVATVLALRSPAAVSMWDGLGRGAGLFLIFACYSVLLAALALLVSARARSATSALLMLLGIWTVTVVLMPRVVAAIAAHRYPTPDSGTFWAQTSTAIETVRPRRGSEEFRAVQREVLSRALGRTVDPQHIAAQGLDRRGLNLEATEVLDARVYADAYRSLHDTYQKQHEMRRWAALLFPAIALQHASAVLSGTDMSAHEQFALQAEDQRQRIIRAINEDLLLNGAKSGAAYVSSADLWRRIPRFVYRPPGLWIALRSAAGDIAVLVLWSVAAVLLAWRGARCVSLS